MQGRGHGQQSTWLPQLAQNFECQNEFDVHWCVLDYSANNSSKIVKWGQTFHQIRTTSISIGLLCGRIPQVLSFRRLFKEIRPDLVHCWGTENLHGAAMAAFNGPTVLSMQGIIKTYRGTGNLPGWRWSLFEHWELGSVKRATVVTCESEWGLNEIRKIHPPKSEKLVEYGVFPTYYDVKWNPSNVDPVFLFAGAVNNLKGVDILIKMLKAHPDRGWGIVFAGDGDLCKDLLALNDPKIEMKGCVRTSELQDLMSQSWALIHPARADTSPNVVKEARVIGLPVVGSPHGGHSAYIDDEKDGYVIYSEDPEEWFEKIDLLSGDFSRCQRMSATNHQTYRDYFQPQNTAKKFLDLFREMLHVKS